MPLQTIDIDTLAKALAHGLPRRGLPQRAGSGVAAALALERRPERLSSALPSRVGLTARPARAC